MPRSWCIPCGLSPGRIDLVSEDSHLVRTRLVRSDRYVLSIQNETPSIRLCILLCWISCSMSCTVRKTRLSDWCQDSSDWLWRLKRQSVKMWCWHVRRNTHRGVDCVSWSGWFWSKLVDFHHGLLVSEVWNRIIKSKQRLHKTRTCPSKYYNFDYFHSSISYRRVTNPSRKAPSKLLFLGATLSSK